MAYVLYNLTHLIPRGAKRTNFGIFLSDDRRVLNPGRHRILNNISDITSKYAKKRIVHNGIEYEILRIIEIKSDAVMSPEDRKNLAEVLDLNQNEIDAKYNEKIEAEKAEQVKREEILIQNRRDDQKGLKEDLDSTQRLDLFKKGEGYKDFPNKDGIPSRAGIEINTQSEVSVKENIDIQPLDEIIPEKQEISIPEEVKPEVVIEPKESVEKRDLDAVAKQVADGLEIPNELKFDNEPDEEIPAKKKARRRSRKKKSAQ